jgi:hypothetical protein
VIGASATTDDAGRATFSSLALIGAIGAANVTFQTTNLAQLIAPTSIVAAPASQLPATMTFGAGPAKVIVVNPGQTVSLPTTLPVNAQGAAVSNALVAYTARNPSVVAVTDVAVATDPARVTGGPDAGRTILVASSVAAPGVQDSVVVHVTRSVTGPLLYTDLSAFELSIGATVDVRVMFDARGTGPLSAVTVDVAYPRSFPALLTLLTVQPGAGTTSATSPTAGLVRLTFRVNGPTAASQLVLTPLQVVTASLIDVTLITTGINPPFMSR